MSKLSSWFSANVPAILPAVKSFVNSLLTNPKAKAKKFVGTEADQFYASIDHVTEVATIEKFEKYVTSHIGGSGLGAVVVAQLAGLITAGIASGLVDMRLKATDALTREELNKIVSYIDARIDGARF